MMELYVLRHGIAVDHGTPDYEIDSERPLTSEGAKKMRRIAKTMQKLELSFDLILSSPYVRARQTAEIAAKVLEMEKRLKFSEHLASGGDGKKVVDQLKGTYRSAHSVLLVGHEPYLSQFISVLLTGGTDLSLTLKKGGLCKLTVERLRYGRCARLESLMTPRQMIGA